MDITVPVLRTGMTQRKDKSIIINQLMTRNVVTDNFVKFCLSQTWNHIKNQPHEKILSFLASVINTHISINERTEKRMLIAGISVNPHYAMIMNNILEFLNM